ncbi:hypothetical protein HY522_04845 [bacterium]|nr:hypothetical protein [bacterium]
MKILTALLLFLPSTAFAADPLFALYNVPFGRYDFAKNLSMNAVVIWPEKDQLDAAHRLGLRALVNISPGPDTDAWIQKISGLKSHPALFAWMIYDEPDVNRKPVEQVAWAYRTLKSVDPAHPVYQTLYNPYRYADYAPYCDIFAVVPYIVTKKTPLVADDYRRLHQFIALAKNIVKDKPVHVVLQSFAGLPAWPRPPTPNELMSMAAVASAAGAEGYAFYAYSSNEPWPLPDSSNRFFLMNDTPLMKAIQTSISLLKPVKK